MIINDMTRGFIAHFDDDVYKVIKYVAYVKHSYVITIILVRYINGNVNNNEAILCTYYEKENHWNLAVRSRGEIYADIYKNHTQVTVDYNTVRHMQELMKQEESGEVLVIDYVEKILKQ